MKYITNIDIFYKEINEGLTVIDFSAEWCGPCKTMGPVFDKMSNTYTKAKYFKVDVDQSEDISLKEDISSLPTFRVYKDGKMLGESLGANENNLANLLFKYCN